MGKITYCSCHATWLLCKTSIGYFPDERNDNGNKEFSYSLEGDFVLLKVEDSSANRGEYYWWFFSMIQNM